MVVQVSNILSLLTRAARRSTRFDEVTPSGSRDDEVGSYPARSKRSNRTVAITPLVGSGGLAEPAVAQDHAGAFQLGFDAEPFDVTLEPDRVAVQLVLDLEHFADLPEEFVVR